MASNITPVYPRLPKTKAGQFTSSSVDVFSGGSITYIDLTDTAPTEGLVIKSVSATNTDSNARVLQFYAFDGTSRYRTHAKSVAVNAGNSAGSPVVSSADCLSVDAAPWLPRDGAGNPAWVLESGWKLQVAVQVKPTNTVEVVCTYGTLTQ